MLLTRILLLSMLAVTVMSYMSKPLLRDRFTEKLRSCRKKRNCCTDSFSLLYLSSMGKSIGMQLHCCNDTEYLPTFQTCRNNVIIDRGNSHRLCNGLPYNDTTHVCCPATYGAVAIPSCQTDGTFEDECDCQKYYICKSGQRKSATCPFGKNWNSRLKKCETEPARVQDQCRLRPYRKPGIAWIRMQVFLPVCRLHHSCCSRFRKYMSQNAPGLLNCCGNTEYVPAYQTCKNDENIFNNIGDSQLCYNLPYNTVTHVCCDLYRGPVELPKCTKDGMYEDMCDCQKYYVCNNGRRTSHSCPPYQYSTRTGTALTCQKHYKNLFQICLSRLYHQNVLVQMEVPSGVGDYIRRDDHEEFLLRNCRLHDNCCRHTALHARSTIKLGCCGNADYNPKYQECHQNALRDLANFPKCHGRPYNSTTDVCCEELRQPVALPTCQVDGKFRDECDCGKYYECKGGKRERKECKEGKWFNELPGSSRCLTAFPDVRRQCDVRSYSPDVDVSVKMIGQLVGACDDISVTTDRKELLNKSRQVRDQLLKKIKKLKKEYGESIQKQMSSTRVVKDSKRTKKTMTYKHPAIQTSYNKTILDNFRDGEANLAVEYFLQLVSEDLARYFVTVRLSLLESELSHANVIKKQIEEIASLLLNKICFLRRLSGSSLDDFNFRVDLKLLDIAEVWTRSTPSELKSWVYEMYTNLHTFVKTLLF